MLDFGACFQGRIRVYYAGILMCSFLISRNAGSDRSVFSGKTERGRSMAVLIFAFWVVLNGRVTVEIAALGVGVTALAMVFLCKCCDWSLKREGGLYVSVPRMIGYACVVIREIVKANLKLCRVVYRGRPDPVVRVIDTRLKSRMARMILANSITLTPGTITLSCREHELIVHCLTREMAQGLDHTIFEEKLEKIEEALHG